eukprot:TRINITY_DN4681_c0_g2_i1.p1 TRINITY_DN4681_c0_g2~~TRINITY_DN4681_c0_g2_i1.p1  ORF type:complete len:948 (+),score=120.54 TRINITY_DN4681_c0_g2_i1:94-2937(+)
MHAAVAAAAISPSTHRSRLMATRSGNNGSGDSLMDNVARLKREALLRRGPVYRQDERRPPQVPPGARGALPNPRQLSGMGRKELAGLCRWLGHPDTEVLDRVDCVLWLLQLRENEALQEDDSPGLGPRQDASDFFADEDDADEPPPDSAFPRSRTDHPRPPPPLERRSSTTPLPLPPGRDDQLRDVVPRGRPPPVPSSVEGRRSNSGGDGPFDNAYPEAQMHPSPHSTSGGSGDAREAPADGVQGPTAAGRQSPDGTRHSSPAQQNSPALSERQQTQPAPQLSPTASPRHGEPPSDVEGGSGFSPRTLTQTSTFGQRMNTCEGMTPPRMFSPSARRRLSMGKPQNQLVIRGGAARGAHRALSLQSAQTLDNLTVEDLDRLERTFFAMDTDRTGSLDFIELQQMWREVFPSLTDDEVDRVTGFIFQDIDVDGDAEVTWHELKSYIDGRYDCPETQEVASVVGLASFVKHASPESWRHCVWAIMEPSASEQYSLQWLRVASVCVNAISQGVIVVATGGLILEALPELKDDYAPAASQIETACVIVFTLEFIFRCICCPCKPTADPRLLICQAQFWSNVLTWVDVVSVVPFYLGAIGLLPNGEDDPGVNYSFVRILRLVRLVRVLRMLKLGRHSQGIQLFMIAVSRARLAFVWMVLLLVMTVVFFAFFLYYAELTQADHVNGTWVRWNNSDFHDAGQKIQFQSITDAMWCSIGTLTGSSYGDIVPRSRAGRAVASWCMVTGLLITAYPITIITVTFSDVWDQYKRGLDVKHRRKRLLQIGVGRQRRTSEKDRRMLNRAQRQAQEFRRRASQTPGAASDNGGWNPLTNAIVTLEKHANLSGSSAKDLALPGAPHAASPVEAGSEQAAGRPSSSKSPEQEPVSRADSRLDLGNVDLSLYSRRESAVSLLPTAVRRSTVQWDASDGNSTGHGQRESPPTRPKGTGAADHRGPA